MAEDLSIRELSRRILAKEGLMQAFAREQYSLGIALQNGEEKDKRQELNNLLRAEITVYIQMADLALKLAYKILHEGDSNG